MEFRILGPLEVVEGDRQVPVNGVRERALRAVLLIHAGEAVSADRLIDELWGNDLPGNPPNALQVVSRVRRALDMSRAPSRPAELLVTRKPGYLLDVAPEALDARRFERLVEQAQQATAMDRRSSLLGEALGLWRGPVLAEFALQDFVREEIARLEEVRIRAIEMKMEADLALRVLQEGRKALVDEPGVDPGPELPELHQQILLQAAPLAAPHAEDRPQAKGAPSNLPAPSLTACG